MVMLSVFIKVILRSDVCRYEGWTGHSCTYLHFQIYKIEAADWVHGIEVKVLHQMEGPSVHLLLLVMNTAWCCFQAILQLQDVILKQNVLDVCSNTTAFLMLLHILSLSFQGLEHARTPGDASQTICIQAYVWRVTITWWNVSSLATLSVAWCTSFTSQQCA